MNNINLLFLASYVMRYIYNWYQIAQNKTYGASVLVIILVILIVILFQWRLGPRTWLPTSALYLCNKYSALSDCQQIYLILFK